MCQVLCQDCGGERKTDRSRHQGDSDEAMVSVWGGESSRLKGLREMEIKAASIDGILKECLSKEVTFEQSPGCSEGESCMKCPPKAVYSTGTSKYKAFEGGITLEPLKNTKMANGTVVGGVERDGGNGRR